MSDFDTYLEDLQLGLPGVTVNRGATHAEACLVCFLSQNHTSGVAMQIEGTYLSQCKIYWSMERSDQIFRAWNDDTEATESAACGIAFLLILRLTDFTVIERTRKGTGFDYFLGYKDALFLENAARLEISGIRRANSSKEIEQRVKDKINQTNVSDNGGLPAYIVVVEFSNPISHVVKK